MRSLECSSMPGYTRQGVLLKHCSHMSVARQPWRFGRKHRYSQRCIGFRQEWDQHMILHELHEVPSATHSQGGDIHRHHNDTSSPFPHGLGSRSLHRGMTDLRAIHPLEAGRRSGRRLRRSFLDSRRSDRRTRLHQSATVWVRGRSVVPVRLVVPVRPEHRRSSAGMLGLTSRRSVCSRIPLRSVRPE